MSSLAPAKVNWTLEVLGHRPDGYHEVRTVLQTVELSDMVRVTPAVELELVMTCQAGRSGPGLAGVPPSQNLAYRAAALLRQQAGEPTRGARIELEKAVPVSVGLGGGSSDAAATLRALDRLWGLGLSLTDLTRLGAQLGADVPFFLRGGTALGRGRGDDVASLPDVAHRRLLIVVPRDRRQNKTAVMYARLRPESFSDGEASERLAAAIRGGVSLEDASISNAFEAIVAEVAPKSAAAAGHCRGLGLRPHLAGSGPAQFALLQAGVDSQPLLEALAAAGLDVFETGTMAASKATALVEET